MSQCVVYNNDSGNGGNKTSPTIKSNINKDKLFDPSVDMMVNDFDDERTLEEEEALAAKESEDPQDELCSLQKEGDMPLDELLALYGYGGQQGVERESESDESPEPPPPISEPDTQPSSELTQLYEPLAEPETVTPPLECLDASRLLRSVSRTHSDEEEEDYDYSPDEDEWKKTIMVGSDYQAVIPEGLSNYDDVLPYENEDKLLWEPWPVDELSTEEYLGRVAAARPPAALPCGAALRDDEQALFLLLQCGHNVDEALRRTRINHTPPPAHTMSLWSEDECRNFENGLRSYGKDFHMIQQQKVRTRSVGELVQFYYLWKKTERHDVFANKTRLEKKKYTLHPGLTDFMDRFLEEQDAGRDRSSSPKDINNATAPDNNKTKLINNSNSPAIDHFLPSPNSAT